jgi:hypothetical protein
MLQGFTILSNAASAIVVVLRKVNHRRMDGKEHGDIIILKPYLRFKSFKAFAKKGIEHLSLQKIKPTL